VCAGYHLVEGKGAFGKDTYTVGVTLESAEKGFGEDFVEFGGVEGPLELTGTREGVLGVGGSYHCRCGGMGDCADFDHC
jgi:hypothetical protein